MRQPTIGRLIALLTAATVIVLLTIDTSLACRFFLRRHYSFAYPRAVSYHHGSGSASPHALVSGGVNCGQPVYDDCCAAQVDSSPSSGYSDGQIIGAPVEGTVIESTPTPAVPSVVPGAGDAGASEVPRGSSSATPPPAFTDLDEGDVEPAIVEEPSDASPVLPNDDLPDDDLPFDDLPADDLPDDDLPADDLPDDDLFGATPTETSPLDATDAADDDLFGPPPTDDMPADDLDLFDQPPAEPLEDDLFGTPADRDEPPLPALDGPLPSGTPGDAAPAVPADADEEVESLDDLFGTSSDRGSEPRTAAAVSDPASSDLFAAPPIPADDVDSAVDDLFSEPVETPAQPEQNNDQSVDDLDDLFGARSAPAAPVTPSATRPVAERIRELPERLWTDNTGHFQTVGRLVKVSNTHVRLLKDNGRYTTVPKYRLSEADTNYLREVTEQLGVETFDQVARR